MWSTRAACAALAAVIGVQIGVTAGPVPSDPFDGNKLFADLTTYFEFGEHRTATKADVATGNWLERRLEQAGLEVRSHQWRLRQFFLDSSTLRVGSTELDGFPYWLPRATEAEGVRGVLVAADADTDPAALQDRIAVVDIRDVRSSAGIAKAITALASAGARGMIVITGGPSGLPVAKNTWPPYSEQATPIPALIVGGDAETTLSAAIRDGTPATLTVRGTLEQGATARNVIGVLDRGGRWIVVSTPYSGWFGCAGERGSGITIWLALAEWAARSDSKLSWLFVANSGHEIAYMGAEKSLESGLIPAPEKTTCWLHLGAAIGVVDWQKVDGTWQRDPSVPRVNVMTIPDWEAITKTSFVEVTGIRMTTENKAGELGNVHRRGYRAFGLIGGGANPWGHTRADTSDSAEPATLELIARATAATLAAIEQEGQRNPAKHAD